MTKFLTLLSGILFGFGLALSGMVSPSKVVGFLDITGNWDPSLIFVIGGGVAVTGVSFYFLLRRPIPFSGERFTLPTRKDIDARLITGAGIFGLGWGIGGFCPGPALSSLAYGKVEIFLFVGAMIVGMVIAKFVTGAFKPAAQQA